MGCCGMRGLIIWSAIIAGLGYYLYSPIPDGIQEKGKLRIVLAMMRIFNDIGNFVDYIGWMDNITFLRKLFDASAKKILPPNDSTMTMTEQYFDGVRVLVYDPPGRPKNSAAMVYYHGGGWVLMSPEAFDPVTREISRRLNILVVSVDYRLAPEHKFPIPFEDCEKATVYFLKNAAEKFSVDPTRVAVAGDSAGGNLAAAVSLSIAKQPDIPPPKLQILIYPALQMMNFDTPAYQRYGYLNILSKAMMVRFWMAYVSGSEWKDHFKTAMENKHVDQSLRKFSNNIDLENVKDYLYPGYVPSTFKTPVAKTSSALKSVMVNPKLSPLMSSSEDLRNQPESFFIIANYDLLRDDGVMYSRRLQDAGNIVTMIQYDKTHGFYSMEEGKGEAADDLVNFLDARL